MSGGASVIPLPVKQPPLIEPKESETVKQFFIRTFGTPAKKEEAQDVRSTTTTK